VRRSTLRTHLLAPLLAASLALLGLLTWVLYRGFEADRAGAREVSLRLAETVAAASEAFLRDSRLMLEALTERPLVRAADPAGCDPLLNELPTLLREPANVVLLDPTGRLICSAVPFAGSVTATDRRWFREAVESGGFTISEPLVGRLTGAWVVMLAQPLRDAGGGIRGVLGLPIRLLRFQELLAHVRLPRLATMMILDPGGRVISSSVDPEEWIGSEIPDAEITRHALAAERGQFVAAGLDGVEREWGSATVPGAGWRVVVGRVSSDVAAETRSEAIRSGLVVLLAALVILWLVVAIDRRVTGPVRNLTAAAEDAAVRGVKPVFDVGGPADLASLAGALNALIEQRDAAEAGRRRVLDRVSDGFAAVDREWRYTFVNERGSELLQKRPEDLLGRKVWEVFPDATGAFHSACERALETREKVELVEYYEGIGVWLENWIYPAADGLTIYFRDVTASRRASAALRESENRLRLAVSAANAGVWEWDMVAHRTYWSPEVYRGYGLEPGSVEPGRATWLGCLHPDDREAANRAVVEAVEEGHDLDIEFRAVLANGELRWFRDVGSTIHDEAGNPRVLLGIQIDVTAQKRAEQERRDAEEALRRLNSELEQRVEERTDELARMVRLMSGREERMAELKLTIRELHRQLREAGLVPAADDPLRSGRRH